MSYKKNLKEIKNITTPEGLASDSIFPLQVSMYYKKKIHSIINDQIKNDSLTRKQKNILIGKVIKKYQERVIELCEDFIQNEDIKTNKPINLFVFAKAKKLARYSKITKAIGNLIGSCLEDIALISPYALSYKNEFKLKVKGVDLVIKDGNSFYHVQLKTKRDTLTGSQSDRVNFELGIFPRSYFVASFSLGGSWTFASKKTNIKRLEGEEFWNKLDLDYSFIERKIMKMLRDLEKYADGIAT